MLPQLDVIEQKKFQSTLIVGWNVESINLYDRILNAPALGFDIRGFIRPAGIKEKTHYKNVPVLGDLSKLPEILVKYQISEVLIVLSPLEKQYLSSIITSCTNSGVNYKVISDTYGEEYSHVIRGILKDVLKPGDLGPRRIVDVLSAVILLIFLFPLFIVVSIAIKLESSGPVFYSQQRYGKDGKIFAVHKFRSMSQDAETKSGPVWAQKRDPRITRIGFFMRKTRIDELPQLMNVLKGDMSFIGPRPERPFFADTFKKQIPFYLNRLQVKPGITGLAQVTVGYDETIEDVKEKVSRDLEYIEKANTWKMNTSVLWKTVLTVLTAEGQ